MDIAHSTDFPFALTKSIASLRDISKRSGTYSNTFIIPATKDNNQLLHYLYSANQKLVKDMRNKKTAIVLVDDIIIERGYIKITKSITTPTEKSYEILFFGDNTEWMALLNDTTLNELSFNQNAQIYSKTNIQNSWDATYSPDEDQTGDATKFDHIHPWISYGSYRVTDQLSIEDMRLAIRYRAIVERALNKIGFKLNSTFMDDTYWKQLIFPLVGDKFRHTDAALTDKLFKAQTLIEHVLPGVGTPGIGNGSTLVFPDDSTGSNFDNGPHYDAPNNRYIIPIRGKYRFRLTLFVDSSTSIGAMQLEAILFKNGSRLDSIFGVEPISNISNNIPFIMDLGYFEFDIGDEIAFNVKNVGVQFTEIVLKTTSTLTLIDMSDEIHRGNSYNIADILPETNILSLFADISKLFNLYWRTDNKTKQVYVEDRDNFFNAITSAVDWSTKLASSESYELVFLSDYKKEMKFRYATDSNDAFLEQRNKDKQFSQNEFCSYRHTFPDRFPKGVSFVQTEEIAATYVAVDPNVTTTATPPITSRMWNEANIGGSPPEPSYNFNPRILNFQYVSQVDADSNTLSLNWEGTERTQIPAAVAVSILGNEVKFPLSFAQEDGLISTYYKRTLSVIEEGIQLTAWFNLSTTDYQSFDMRDLVYLAAPEELHGYWIVDTIHDYTPLGGLTKVTLLRFHNNDLSEILISIDSTWGGDIQDTPTTGDFPNQPVEDPIGFGGTKETEGSTTEESPEKRSIVLNNGTKNLAAKHAGALAFGQGCEAYEKNQSMLGSYPIIDKSKFAIGVGTGKDDRITGFRSDVDGNVTMYGGGVYMINENGERVQVTMESGNKIRNVYLK